MILWKPRLVCLHKEARAHGVPWSNNRSRHRKCRKGSARRRGYASSSACVRSKISACGIMSSSLCSSNSSSSSSSSNFRGHGLPVHPVHCAQAALGDLCLDPRTLHRAIQLQHGPVLVLHAPSQRPEQMAGAHTLLLLAMLAPMHMTLAMLLLTPHGPPTCNPHILQRSIRGDLEAGLTAQAQLTQQIALKTTMTTTMGCQSALRSGQHSHMEWEAGGGCPNRRRGRGTVQRGT
mmetsp:Transcript_13162/g.35180  ORF Transcript_13162/g.35180 Transcript_13162/m.35180 type:complete len:234 (+) Transcript_13162:5647-6348(+)